MSKQGIRWPVSHDRTAGSSVYPSRWSIREVIRWQITSFKWSQAQVYFFQGFISNMLCLCHYGPALLGFWFQTDLGRENSASFLKIQAGKTFSYHGHALVTFYVQFLCSDMSKFDRWVHAENLCSILKVVNFSSTLRAVVCPGRTLRVRSAETTAPRVLWQLRLTEFCLNLWCF